MTYKGKQEIPPWVIQEAERKPRRKPGPKPKPAESKYVKYVPKLYVKINLTGSVEFELDGDDAARLKEMLERPGLDEIIEFVDPWASGAELRYDVEVTDPTGLNQWEANETTGTIELTMPDPWRFR